ncbi:MAG: hypothetical protein R2788_10165 [Saprospiraceae bacterium]
MENSRLLQLLRTLTKNEMSEMKKVLASPFFNHRTDVSTLYDYLLKYLKNGKPVPAKEEVFPVVFPKEKYDDHRLRLCMSLLYQLTCQYLTYTEFLNDEVAAQMRLSSLFRKRNLHTHFDTAWKNLSEKHERNTLRNAAYFQRKYQFSLEKYRSDYNLKNVDRTFLQDLSNQLDVGFLIQKLAHSCFLISHQAVSNASYDFGLLEKMLSYIEETDVLDIPAIAIYYNCYKALTNPAEQRYFQKFRELALLHDALFLPEELRDLYILAINFCIRQYNEGNSEYLPFQFQFYKDGLEKGYFLTAGWLSRYTYQNVVTIGLVTEEFDWVERFIHEYRERLQEPYRESVFSFNLARLEYQRRHFGKALDMLQKAEYKDLLLNLAAKTLQMKIFYENQEYDLLDSHLQAFKIFIRRKNALGYHRENYLNTIYLTRKLLEINPFDKKEKAALKKEIEETKGVGDKDWLLAQLS